MANLDFANPITVKAMIKVKSKNPGFSDAQVREFLGGLVDQGKVPATEYAELATGSVAPAETPAVTPAPVTPVASPAPVTGPQTLEDIQGEQNPLTAEKVKEGLQFVIDPLKGVKDRAINNIASVGYDIVNGVKEGVKNLSEHSTLKPTDKQKKNDQLMAVAKQYVQNKQSKDPNYNMSQFGKTFQIVDGQWKKR